MSPTTIAERVTPRLSARESNASMSSVRSQKLTGRPAGVAIGTYYVCGRP